MLRNVIRHWTHVGLVSDFPSCVVAPQLMICSNKEANQRTLHGGSGKSNRMSNAEVEEPTAEA